MSDSGEQETKSAGPDKEIFMTPNKAGGALRTALIIIACLFFTSPEISAGTITVNNAADSGTGTLRQAIANAVSGDTITFAGDYSITLASELTVSKNLTIDGTDHTIVISGNHTTRVFNVTAGVVTFKALTITAGNVQTRDCAGYTTYQCGGGIMLQDTAGISVTVDSCTVSNNSAEFGGGGIFTNNRPLTVINSTFSGNSTNGAGGAIDVHWQGRLIVTNSTFFGNSANCGGGLQYSDYSGIGGTVTNSTFSGNTASNGGAICDPEHDLTVNNSIVVNNSGSNCYPGVYSFVKGTGNLADDTSCGGGFTNSADILLGAAGNYGGTTQNFPLLPGSAAIDAASTNCPSADQRGVLRSIPCDIGAFESRGFQLAKTGGDNQSALFTHAFSSPLTVNVTSAYGEPVNGGKVTFTPPASGAGAAVSGSPAVIAGGFASATATANSMSSSYSVTAAARGAASADFSLTNTCTSSPVVVNSANSGPGSLREAIATACPGSTITFAGDYTILLAGELVISRDLTLDAADRVVTVSGNHVTRVFNVTAGLVTFRGLTIADGNVRTHDCTSSWNCGGGLMLQNNSAIVVTVVNSAFLNNEAILNTTSATFGGAIFQQNGNLTVTNTTFSGNDADYGGAISRTGGTMTITNCTFSSNTGSVGSFDNRGGGSVSLRNTLMAKGTSGSNCYNGAALSGGNNLADDSSCGSSFTYSGAIRLGSPGNYGGNTWTVPLLLGSSALDAGDDAVCPAADQRGVARPQYTHCDIGAYEMMEGYTETVLHSSPNTSMAGQEVTFTATVTGIGGTPGGTVQFNLDSLPFGTPVALSGGTAGMTTSALTVGRHLITATYSGDATFLGSISAALEQAVCASAIAVVNADDSGQGSLRAAVDNICAGGVITFAGDYTIYLANQLTISRNMTIDGTGRSVTISGDTGNPMGPVRAFQVEAGTAFNLARLTITTASESDTGGGGGGGGGIRNFGSMAVSDVAISNCSGSTGGGIYNEGTAILTNVILDGNFGYVGGGIYNAGELTVANSTFSGNFGYYGGDSLVTGYLGTTHLLNTTINSNAEYAAGRGGSGVHIESQGVMNYTNTIITGLDGNPHCLNNGGTIGTNSHNLVKDGSCSSLISGDPQLGPLADNGGFTKTFALLPGSPARDAGDDAVCSGPVVNGLDQRGVSRSQGVHCDIGSYERRAPHFIVSAPAAATAGTPFDYSVSIEDEPGYLLTEYAGTIHFTSSDSGATMPADALLTNGTGSFAAALKKAGNQTITAMDAANALLSGTSGPVAVAADAATLLSIISGSGQSAGPGAVFSAPLVVMATDAFNNPVPGVSVAFNTAGSGPGAAITGSPATTNLGGEAAATAQANTIAGSYTVTASISGSTAHFNLTNKPGPASALIMTAPDSVIGGLAFNVTVTAKDSFSNTAAGYTGPVHFTSADGQAILPPDSTLTGGVRTFSATMMTSGPQAMTVTDAANATVKGNVLIAVTLLAVTSNTVTPGGTLLCMPSSLLYGADFSCDICPLKGYDLNLLTDNSEDRRSLAAVNGACYVYSVANTTEDHEITAGYQNFPVIILSEAGSDTFSDVPSAFAAVKTGERIQMQGGTYTGLPDFNHPGVAASLEGGYNSSFSTITGEESVISETLTITSGTLAVREITIK